MERLVNKCRRPILAGLIWLRSVFNLSAIRRKPDPAGICDIPEVPDLIIEILLRLPVKSLLKFRCVSRSWCYLISSKYFVESQLNFATNNTNYVRVLVSQDRTWESDCLLDQFKQYNLDGLLNKVDVDTAEFYYPLSNEATWFIFIGSYNGLCCAGIETRKSCLCIETRKSCLFVWNPSTRKSRILPYINGMTSEYCGTNIGFGFDGADYKVVVISYKIHPASRTNVIELYSSRINAWKRIYVDDKVMPFDMSRYYRLGKFANGKLYWMREDGGDLFYFDLGSAAYGTEPLPSSTASDISLEVLGECLCLISNHKTSMDVWVLKQNGSKYESWNKMVSIDIQHLCSTAPKPKWMTGESEILISMFDSGVFKFYDPKSNSLQLSNTINGSSRRHQTDVYVTSLVSPFPDDCDLNQGERSLVA